jgi:hypothetical protein
VFNKVESVLETLRPAQVEKELGKMEKNYSQRVLKTDTKSSRLSHLSCGFELSMSERVATPLMFMED